MSTNEENYLEDKAYEQLDYCCESACTKQHIQDYIKYLEDKIRELKEELDGRTN